MHKYVKMRFQNEFQGSFSKLIFEQIANIISNII